MNYTTNDYLTQLQQDKDDLVDNLTEMGIEDLTGDETFTELVPEVLNIPSGGDISEYFTSNITYAFSQDIKSPWKTTIKKLPPFVNSGNSCQKFFYEFQGNIIDLSNFNTSNVTNMTLMFAMTSELREIIKLSNLTTPSVTNMNGMFRDCKITELDLSHFNTSNVTNMSSMFTRCEELTNLKIGNWDTNKVTTMYQMFFFCTKLTELDISSFSTPLVTDTTQMFQGCNLLMKIDMRNFNFTTITNYSNMFGGTSSNGVPDNCLIIVKDQTQKDWINTNFSRLTNVQTVAEYEANN